jgi:PAS domain S-box-containing protein
MKAPSRYEVKILRKDGSIRHVETNATAIIWEGKLAVLSINRDITEQKEQKELTETFRGFMKSASESFVVFDSELRFVEINDIGAQRLGYTRDELTGKRMFDIQPSLEGSERYRQYQEVIETGESKVMDAFYHNTGIEHLRLNAFKVRDGLGLIAIDLTELKREQENRSRLDKELVESRLRTEQLIEMNRLKNNFMNTAAHEIRTPITSVRGYSEIILGLLEMNEYDQIKPHFEAVVRNIDRLEHLSRDLLDMQRIESGRLTVDKKEVTVGTILEQVKSEMTPILGEKDQPLIIDNPATDEVVKCDELRVLQVLINLVHNASKYSDYGTDISITVKDLGHSVVFTVKDQGIGLEKEDIPKLFIPFPDIRVRNASHGSGLGLSISKGIIDLHDGIIKAESDGSGMGSTFKVVLPKQ